MLCVFQTVFFSDIQAANRKQDIFWRIMKYLPKNLYKTHAIFIKFDISFFILYNSLAETNCEILSISLEILSLTQKVKL